MLNFAFQILTWLIGFRKVMIAFSEPEVIALTYVDQKLNRMIMKHKHVLAMLVVMVMASCSGKKETTTTPGGSTDTGDVDVTPSATIDLSGQWYIENIVFNDSVNVRPAEEVPDVKQYIVFNGNSFNIQTNCNTIQGEYKIVGDSITFPITLTTEMACDNMATEEALSRILPDIATVDVVNDSITRLNSRVASAYIVLRKAK